MSDQKADYIKLLKDFKETFQKSNRHPEIKTGDIRDEESLQWELGASLILLVEKGHAEDLKRIIDLINAYRSADQFAHGFLHLIQSNSPQSNLSELKIGPNDEQLIRENLGRFKIALQEQVDKYGGVSRLALAIGMSQPSISRTLNSESVPRAATLRKIFDGLGISVIELK